MKRIKTSKHLCNKGHNKTFITKIGILLVIFLLASPAKGQHVEGMYDAIATKNYMKIVLLSSYPECDTIAIDALCTLPYFSSVPYEAVLTLYENSSNGTMVQSFLCQLKDEKEKEIRESLSTMSLEDLSEYIIQNPVRKPIVSEYLKKTISCNLSSLSYKELAYLQNNLPLFEAKRVKEEMNSRKEEKRQIMTNCIGNYIEKEKATDKQIKYVLEKIIWTYYLEGSKKSLEAYSKIGMVPDDAILAASQYQRIVHSIISPKQLQKMLQEEINKYCTEINMAREDNASFAGKSSFKHMSYKVPLMNFNTNVGYDDLWEIYRTRQQFVRDREKVEEGSSVIGWLTSGFIGLALKAVGDLMTIDTLVKSEYEAREKYVLKVQNAILG